MADLLISEQEEPDIRGLSRQQQQPITTTQPQANSAQGQQEEEGRSDGRAIRGFKDTDLAAAVISTSATRTTTPTHIKAGDQQQATSYDSTLTHPPHAQDAQYTNVVGVRGDDKQHRDGLGVSQTPIKSVETGMNRGVSPSYTNYPSSPSHADDHEHEEEKGSTFLFARQYESEPVITNEKGEMDHSSSNKAEMVDPLSPMPYHRFRSQFGNQNQRVPPSTAQPGNGNGNGNGSGLLGIGGILKSRSTHHKSTTTTLGSGVNDMHARFGLLREPRGSPNHLHNNHVGAGGEGGSPGQAGGIPPPVVLENIGPIRPTKSIAELFTPGRKLGSEPGWKESGWNTLKCEFSSGYKLVRGRREIFPRLIFRVYCAPQPLTSSTYSPWSPSPGPCIYPTNNPSSPSSLPFSPSSPSPPSSHSPPNNSLFEWETPSEVSSTPPLETPSNS
jgi:hypothetical protein